MTSLPCSAPQLCCVLLGLAALAATPPVHAAQPVQLVDSLANLQRAIDHAVPGDTITLRNGTYSTTANITVVASGSADLPITIAAETVGGVEISGTAGFDVAAPSAFVVISGFNFTRAAGTSTVEDGTSHVRITRNLFHCTGDGAYLAVGGDDAEIDHNEFFDKKSAEGMVAVVGAGSQVARRVWIHHNYFHDLSSSGINNTEMLCFGLAASSASEGAGLVEYNFFARCSGGSEVVSNRSCRNTYRYNSFRESPAARFTLRYGNDCLIYANYFLQTEGLRIYGDRHLIYSNYFEGNYIGVNLGNGDGLAAEGAPPSIHAQPDGCIIAFNTFVDNRSHYQMSRHSPPALGATNTTFANNLIQGGGIAARLLGPNTGAVWQVNLLWKTAGAGDLPPGTFVEADPLLAPDATGIKRPQAGSPAFGAAAAGFPGVASDLNGRPRPQLKSIGAEEPAAHILALADVGPAAK